MGIKCLPHSVDGTVLHESGNWGRPYLQMDGKTGRHNYEGNCSFDSRQCMGDAGSGAGPMRLE
jgi:hypothetical protein